MLYENCKIGMRVRGIGPLDYYLIGTIQDIETDSVIVKWDDYPIVEWYRAYIKYLEPATQNNHIDIGKEYKFFSVCTMPNCCSLN